ncbi:MAG TPA: PAS domain-containing protein, partial [Chromatiales bacterium]|nr:PAS domain-containing protein [Chromatiales bacterium]HEX22081.1 PAS domain-containing protein [Chromatiales bacterium]
MQSRLNLVKGINQKDLSDFAAASGEGVVALDPAGCLLDMNPEAGRILGWTAVELKGKDFFAETHLKFTDIRTLGSAPCPALNSVNCSHLNINTRLQHRNGTSLDVSFMLSPLFDAGRVVGKLFVFREQGDAQSGTGTEAALVAASASLIVRLDVEGQVQFCNHPGDWLFGDEPTADFIPEAIVTLLRECPNQLDQQTLLDRRWSQHGEREVCVSWSVSVLRDASGAVSGAVCV